MRESNITLIQLVITIDRSMEFMNARNARIQIDLILQGHARNIYHGKSKRPRLQIDTRQLLVVKLFKE